MFDISPCGLHMGSREPPASVLGLDVIFQIAGQKQWVATGHTWWSSIFGDHRGILSGYGVPAHAGESFSTTKAVVSNIWKLSPLSESELFSEVEKESAHEEARSNTAQQRMLKTGEVQDVLQQPRETNQISDIDGLGHPTVAGTCYPSNHGMLNTEEDPPNAEKRGSP